MYRPLVATALLLALQNGVSAREARFAEVGVVPFRVEGRPLPRATPRADEAELLARLSAEATARAERTLVKQGIAARTVRLGSAGAREVPVLEGIVWLPLSLPKRLANRRAFLQKGTFAEVEITLQRGAERVRHFLTLDWDDIRWSFGPRSWRIRRLDDILEDFTRKGVDHAVKRLRRE